MHKHKPASLRTPRSRSKTRAPQPPANTPSRWTQLATSFRKLLWKHKRLYNWLYGAVIGFPPLLISNYYQVEGIRTSVQEFSALAATVLDQRPIVWLLLTMAWSPIAIEGKGWISRRLSETPTGWDEAPQTLLTVLNNVVGHKETRFREHATRFGSDAQQGKLITSDEVFLNITNPRAQIHRLGGAVHNLFSLLLRSPEEPNPRVKVNIALVTSARVEKIMCHFPADVPVISTPEELSNPQSGIMQAHKTGSLIVVEDTQKAACSHGKGYVATHHQSTSAEASLLCYPVKINGSSSGFVVSVLWYKKHGFQKRLSAQYEKLLEPFRCRLRLEYYLSHLKGLVNEKHDAT